MAQDKKEDSKSASNTSQLARGERAAAIEALTGTIEKQFGKGAIMRLGEGMALPEVTVIPTGSLALDIALGCGGFPRGRVVEIYGPESSGKTTLALSAIAEAQRRGGVCAFIDAEHALDVSYAKQAGRAHRRSAGVAAGQRRAGAGDRRHAGALGRHRHRRGRLGGGAGAQGRDRRRDGRSARRSAGALDVPGAAQADRYDQQVATPWSSSSTRSA